MKPFDSQKEMHDSMVLVVPACAAPESERVGPLSLKAVNSGQLQLLFLDIT